MNTVSMQLQVRLSFRNRSVRSYIETYGINDDDILTAGTYRFRFVNS